MKEFAVVGRPNSGKTLFALNFAGFLGCRAVDITFRTHDGHLDCRHYLLPEARRELCGSTSHKTRVVQSMILTVPVGKTGVHFKLSDTCGLQEEIHSDQSVRQGMAQTLGLIRSSDYIIHIVDLTALSEDYLSSPTNIDREIYRYGIARHRYLLLANKIDLASGKSHLTRLAAEFPHTALLPISALYNHGFPAVKSYVAHNV
ncbi:MAG: 50S ribosome-binding GTPase [Negativicutes bacterium]|nr:50S ribosome-binding GTPase [Negativicutes bacterium]